jgi:hypothetical protein
MRAVLFLALALLVAGASLSAQSASAIEVEQEAVMTVIETAYIQGIHNERDVDKIRSGFHDDFNMLPFRDDEIGKVSIQQWIEGIERSLERNPDPPDVPVRADFAAVEVSGNAAVARIEVYRGETHLYTDFMSLYKFEDGWKIVAKIYYSHPG